MYQWPYYLTLLLIASRSFVCCIMLLCRFLKNSYPQSFVHSFLWLTPFVLDFSMLIYINCGSNDTKTSCILNNCRFDPCKHFSTGLKRAVDPLSANPTKWSNTLKQFVGKFADELFEYVWPFCGIGD